MTHSLVMVSSLFSRHNSKRKNVPCLACDEASCRHLGMILRINAHTVRETCTSPPKLMPIFHSRASLQLGLLLYTSILYSFPGDTGHIFAPQLGGLVIKRT